MGVQAYLIPGCLDNGFRIHRFLEGILLVSVIELQAPAVKHIAGGQGFGHGLLADGQHGVLGLRFPVFICPVVGTGHQRSVRDLYGGIHGSSGQSLAPHGTGVIPHIYGVRALGDHDHEPVLFFVAGVIGALIQVAHLQRGGGHVHPVGIDQGTAHLEGAAAVSAVIVTAEGDIGNVIARVAGNGNDLGSIVGQRIGGLPLYPVVDLYMAGKIISGSRSLCGPSYSVIADNGIIPADFGTIAAESILLLLCFQLALAAGHGQNRHHGHQHENRQKHG